MGTDEEKNTGDEIAARRDAALLRALSTPHKRQKEMKVGKRKPSREPKNLTRPTVRLTTLTRF
jgi:hypothetical protein